MADRANKSIKLQIDGDNSGAVNAVNSTIDQLEQLRADAKKPLDKISSFEKATIDLKALRDALEESRRKLAYFREQAKLGGDIGAKAFAADIKATEREIDKLNIGIGKQNVKLRELSTALAKSGVDTRDLANEKTRLASATAKAENGLIKLKSRLLEEKDVAAQAAARTREVGNSAATAGAQADGSGKSFLTFANGLRTLAVAAVFKEFVAANASLEGMTKALESVTGSQEAAKREMAFVRAEAKRLGIEIGAATNSYVGLAASAKGTALEGPKTREVWSAVAESMARLGKSSAETDGALLAVSQMMSKGVVSAEELRGQLGERLPGAFQVAARAMGTTTKGLGEMLEAGEVVAADFLPRFAAELRKSSGSGGEIDSFNAQMARMKNSLSGLSTAVGKAGVFDALSWAIGALAKTLDTAVTGWEMLVAKISGGQPDLDKTAAAADGAATGVDKLGTASEKAADKSGKLSGYLKRLADDLKLLGLDKAEIDAELGYMEARYIASFQRIAESSAASGEEIFRALIMAVDKVDSPDGLGRLKKAIYDASSAGKIGFDQLGASINAINTKAAGLWQAMEKGVEETTRLADAYKTLGIQSQATLDATVAKNKEALDVIARSGASLAVQNAAWAKYAEAAIAANGGVAASTITAEAAMRGYTVVVDDAGKTHVAAMQKAKDSTQAMAREQAALHRAIAQSNDELARQILAQDNVIGSMQGSIDGFQAHMQGMGAALASVLNTYRQEMHALSAETEQYFTRFARASGGLGSISGYLEHLAIAARDTRLAFDEAQAQAADYVARLADGKNDVDDLTEAMQFLSSGVHDNFLGMQLLGEEQLQPLRAAIADAQRRMEDLRDSAQSTLDDIQDEWDQLNNNLDEIERRRAEKREAELLAQIAAARAAGDREALADLERALSLLKQITAARIADAKEQERANRSSGSSGSSGSSTGDRTGGMSTGSASSGAAVNINLNGLITSSPAEIARLLKPEIDKLTRLSA